ncbi:TPA: hypothetical protein IRB04_004828 [Escherichia coli]|nr:hypothetical protein [Escherichia coli]HAO7325189.1 hypothetical protein [Escherichia coli]
MWVRKLRSLPWRVIMLAILLNTFLLAIWWLGYSTGHDRASADGQAALSRLQADFDGYRAEQARREVAALRAWSERYQEQVAAGQRAEAGYLEQIAQLEDQNKQLQGQINDVTQRWIDEKGKSHPIECVFTRGFVRQYNAALGYDNASFDTGHSDSVAAAGTGTGAATGQPETADARLRNSGVSQLDVLANIIDNAGQCRRWRNQINALLDEREGLQK